MSGHLSASFFGGFELRRDGELVAGFAYDKVKALFAYLAIEPALPVERGLLAGLLWPEQSEEKARHSLRQALSQLRAAIGEDSFETPVFLAHRTALQRNRQAGLETDVEKFEGNLNRPFADEREEIACLQAAVELYQGELLAGLSLAQTASFEEWLASRREHYHRRAVAALEKIVIFHEGQMAYARARTFAERWVGLEPWREAAHRKLMLILARMGRRSLALKQYERCRRVLSEEFGLEPDAQTELLFQRIRSMGSAKADLPHPATPFIGRQDELSLLSRYLVNPDVRLITILGPGGIGKSRLAIQSGRLVAGEGGRLFLNGAVFVPLDSVSEQERLVAAIAQALSYTFEPGEDPGSQLLRYLKDKELLLILDNFEQLVGETSRGFLVSLVKETGDLKLLVTSREKLNLRSEFLLQLKGLQIPDLNGSSAGISLQDAQAHSAVEFLMSVLKQVKPDIILTVEDIPVLVRICRLVEGMPLALELAASWSDAFPLEEIARQVERGMHFLKADWGDMPARHRSIRAVIDVSWKLLAERERAVFRRLSVFQGGFSRQAARAVAGASTSTLSRLVSKSFLQYDSKADRYRIHELLRQYGEENLALDPAVSDQAGDQHAGYFAAFMAKQAPLSMRPDEKKSLKEIEIELKNVVAAWKWSVSRGSIAALAQAAGALHHFYLRSVRFQEGAAIFQMATGALDPGAGAHAGETIAWITAYGGDLCARGGDWQLGRKLLQRSLKVIEAPGLQGRDTRAVKAFVQHCLGTFTLEAEQARQLLLDSLDLYRDLEDRRQMARVLAHIGDLWRNLGHLQKARSALEEGLAIQQELGLSAEKIRTLSRLALLAVRRGDLPESERLSREAVALAKREKDQDRLAASLEEQGLCHLISGRFILAERCFTESTEIRLDLGQQLNALISRAYLCYANLHLGRFKHAEILAQRLYPMAKERGDLPTKANALWALGMAALVDRSYDESRQRLQECIANYRAGWQQDWRGRRASALAHLACADCHQGLLAQARDHLRQALKTNIEIRSYIGLLNSLQGIALLFLKQGRTELAVEVYELARTQPVVANSVWFKWAIGRHIDSVAGSMPPELLAKARRQGKARDLWGTAAELLEYLNKDH